MRENRRNLNVEVLRCILMYLVVLDHCFAYGVYRDIGMESLWALPFSVLLFWHVPTFVSISGYYGIRFSIRRFLSIFGNVIFYSTLSMCIKFLTSGTFGAKDIRIEAGWFGGAYLCLLLIVPFLNAAIDGLIAESRSRLLITWCGLATVIVVNWLPRQAMTGMSAQGIGPYTLALMTFIYISSRVFSLCFKNDCTALHCLFVIGGGICTNIALFFLGMQDKCLYNSPIVILMAIAVVALFDRYICLPQFICSAANKIAPSMFGVYLCHATTCFGIEYIRRLEQTIYSIWGNMPFTVVLSSLIVFTSCLVIDIIRRGMLVGVQRAFKRA